MEGLTDLGGYALSSITYLVLASLFSFVPNKNVVTRSLVFFCLCFSVWAFGNTAFVVYQVSFASPYYFLFEYIRYCGLAILLLSLLSRHSSIRQVINSPQFLIINILLAIAVFISFVGVQYKQLAFTLVLAVIIFLLILIETIFSKSKDKLWALKPLILCLFTLLIIDFVLYAEAALFIQFEPNIVIAKSYLNFILAPLLLWSIRRTTELQVKVYVSREIVFQSTMVMGAGIYLGLLATVGFYIQQFEQAWTPILQIVFVILGFILLIAILWSHSFKTSIKVFIQKNFFANKFDYRAQWLALTESLAKDDNVYQSVMNTLVLSLNGHYGMLVKFEQGKTVVVVDDKDKHQDSFDSMYDVLKGQFEFNKQAIELNEYEDFPALTEQLFHVAMPITDGQKLWGFALVSQDKENYVSIDWEVSEYLQVVSSQVAHYLFQHEANEQLMENAQFAAFSRMSAFVVHDLKNVLAQIQMINANSVKHRNNQEFVDDTFETLTHTQSRLEKVIKQLKEKKVDGDDSQHLDVKNAISSAIESRFSELENITLSLQANCYINANEDRFTNVICHIVDNALQASNPEDKVNIGMQVEEKTARITISDSGKGMTEEFIKNRLFKPFETTKGNAGMGIGAYDAKVFVEELGGEVVVTSEVDIGTQFCLNIPLAQS